MKEGEVLTVPYPFVRSTFTGMDADEEGPHEFTLPTWIPGTRYEHGISSDEREWSENYADGMGAMLLTVISVHKPGRFPTRVFYTRQWRDPEGKTFGKSKLFVKVSSAFLRLTQGYRVPFELVASEVGK